MIQPQSLVGSASAQDLPSGYPKEYNEIIKGAKSEGKLLIYSNMSLQNWKPLLEGFNARFPGISVDLLDVGSRESI